MHTDARTLDSGAVLEGDLCIVGAGAAGISIALEWVSSSRKVILLEGGGFDLDPVMQDLYRGDIVGQPYFPLHAAALRYFGGTTNAWGGFCATFDAIDFEPRPWVPHSGWPIQREDLDPFYARAHRVLELGPYAYDVDDWVRRHADLAAPPLDPRVAWTKMWRFSPPTRFGTKYRDAIVNARDVHLYTHASVCEVEANDALSAVQGLRVRTLTGKELRARARCYVLACSAIQNARLLLASNRQAAAGLGNAHDLVGRYFMEHLEIPSAKLTVTEQQAGRMKLYAWEPGRTEARGELALTAQVQRDERLLNGTASLAPALAGDGQEAKGTFQVFTPEVLAALLAWEKAGRNGPPPMDVAVAGAVAEPRADSAASAPPRSFHLMTRQEQAPNPDSRITLSSETDALGMPRVKLDWRLTDLEKRSMRSFYQILGQEIERSGVGRVEIGAWLLEDDPSWPPFLSGGWHHMGTTRMHEDPRQGVVDPSCRVHGLANLYVAGAAVYPTAGAANPTLTLVSLSLRLSDHLRTVLG